MAAQMTDIIDENWEISVCKIAQNFWLAYAYKQTNTSGAYALEKHISSKRPRESKEHSNIFKRHKSGQTKPAKATMLQVEKVAIGATAILEHKVWSLLMCNNFDAGYHLAALNDHNISEEIRLVADTKLPKIIKDNDISFLDRLEIVVRVAALASLQGDVSVFRQAKKQSGILLINFPSYVPLHLKLELCSLVNRWFEVKQGNVKKNQIALIKSKSDYKLLIPSVFFLCIPFFEDHASIQALSTITGTYLLLAVFEPRLRYWWIGYRDDQSNKLPSNIDDNA
jgi:hypothetical protein